MCEPAFRELQPSSPECESDPYRAGDYVFSRYYNRYGEKENPLVGCSFGGAAVFAAPEVFEAWTGASQCSEATTTTFTTTTTSTISTTATTSTLTSTTKQAFMVVQGGSPMTGFSLVLLVLLATVAL